eukprot:gene26607-4230_t
MHALMVRIVGPLLSVFDQWDPLLSVFDQLDPLLSVFDQWDPLLSVFDQWDPLLSLTPTDSKLTPTDSKLTPTDAWYYQGKGCLLVWQLARSCLVQLRQGLPLSLEAGQKLPGTAKARVAPRSGS